MKTNITEQTNEPTTSSERNAERNPEYAIYKPNSRGTGGVVRWALSRAKSCLFVECATQSGEKQFDWENKIIMKWGLSDIGTILATLQGRQSQGKLFHQSEKASSTADLTYRDDPERAPYLLSISRQDAIDKSLKKVMIPISHSEASILEIALQQAVKNILDW